MLSVAILINGQPIMARSARNLGELANGDCLYQVDDGSRIVHRPDDGAVVLAKMLLDTIKEQGTGAKPHD